MGSSMVDIQKLWETAERWLGRVHLLWWIAGGVVSAAISSISGFVASSVGLYWLAVALAVFGGLSLSAVTLVSALWLAQLLVGRGLVPLRRALQLAYEGCEGTPTGKYIDQRDKDSETKGLRRNKRINRA